MLMLLNGMKSVLVENKTPQYLSRIKSAIFHHYYKNTSPDTVFR